MEDSRSSEKDPKELGPEPSSGSNNNDNGILISVTSREGVRYNQENGEESQVTNPQKSKTQQNRCAKMKHKAGVRKHYKESTKKSLNKCKITTENNQISVYDVCIGTIPSEKLSGGVTRDNSVEVQPDLTFMPQPVPKTGGKEHVIDEDETDNDAPYSRDSHYNRNVNTGTPLSDIWNDLSSSCPFTQQGSEARQHDQTETQSSSCPFTQQASQARRHDQTETQSSSNNFTQEAFQARQHDQTETQSSSCPFTQEAFQARQYDQTETQNNFSSSVQTNRLDSILEIFLNNGVSLGSEFRVFSAQDDTDVKLLQILRYIKSCDDGLDLLWNFIRNHIELITDTGGRRENLSEGEVEDQTYVMHGSELEDLDIAAIESYEERMTVDELMRQHSEFNEPECEVEDHEENYHDSDDDVVDDGVEESEEESEIEDIEVSEDDDDDYEYDIQNHEGNNTEGDELSEDSDSNSDADSATFNGEGYPYDEIENDYSEEEEDNNTSESDIECNNSGTKSGKRFLDEYRSVCKDLSVLFSDAFNNIETLCSENEEETVVRPTARKEPQTVSVGVQTVSSSSHVEGNNAFHISSYYKVKVRKLRNPYSFKVAQFSKRRNSSKKKLPMRHVSLKHRRLVKKEKMNSKGAHELETVVIDGSSDACSDDDTHCRGDFVNERLKSQENDDKQYNSIGGDLKGGDAVRLRETPLNGVPSIIAGINSQIPDVDITYMPSECPSVLAKNNIDTKCKSVKFHPLRENIGVPLLSVSITDSKPVAGPPSPTENVIEALLLNEDTNEQEQDGRKQPESRKRGCPVWQILRNLECPFKWAPDVFISSVPKNRMQENIITHLTEKEKEFSMAKCNIFREIVVHLVLVYEKTFENRMLEAIADLQHCYALLGNPTVVVPSDITPTEEFDLNSVTGHDLFEEINTKRVEFLRNNNGNITIRKSYFPSHDEYSRTSKPTKHVATVQIGGTDRVVSEVKFVLNEATDKVAQVEGICESSNSSGATKLVDTDLCLDVLFEEKESSKFETSINKSENKESSCEIDKIFENDDDALGLLDTQNKIGKVFTKVEMKINSSSENVEDADKDHVNDENIPNEESQNRYVCNKPEDLCQEDKEEIVTCNLKHAETDFEATDVIGNTFKVDTNRPDCNHEKNGIDLPNVLISDESSRVFDVNNTGTKNKNSTGAAIINDELEGYGRSFEDKSFKEESEEELESQRKEAMLYVLNATLAYVAYFSEINQEAYKCNQEAYKFAKHIENSYNQLGRAGQAMVSALRGAILMEYGFTGNQLGLQFLQHALELDPNHWEWNLYCGKVLGRLRRVEKCNGSVPSAEELKYLEKAVELHREDASTLVHLANLYRSLAYFKHKQKMEAQAKAGSVMETRHYVRSGGSSNWRANWSQSRHAQQQEKPDPLHRWRNPQQLPEPRPLIPLEADQKDYLQLAKELFLEALEAEPHCPYNNARCAKSLWSMPYPYKNKELAQNAILRALTLAPDDSLVNHYAGLFYEHCHDYEKALLCFERATTDSKQNYPAEMNYINLKMKLGPQGSYSPVFRLDKLISKYPSPNLMQQTLCHKALYLYKVDEQYFQAIRNFVSAIEIDPNSQILKTFYPGNFYRRIISYNIFDLLEEIASKYKNCPDAIENKDFVEEVFENLRRFREENCKDNDGA